MLRPNKTFKKTTIQQNKTIGLQLCYTVVKNGPLKLETQEE
jgi:hypothetical protein